jgi:F420-dependent oxidoreductase-like protein
MADEAGFDHIWPFDHLIALGNDPTRLIFDGWTILGAVAENTKRTRIGLNVTGIPYRHPGVLAKIAVTVDHLSRGRLEMGVGAAWNEPEFRMYGIPFPSTADRIRAMDEACSAMKALWTDERATFKGKYFKLDQAIAEPKPVQKPWPPIWIGGVGPKLTLRVVAKHADVWNSNAPTPDDSVKLNRVLDEHCAKVGRDPASIRRSSQLRGDNEDAILRIGETVMKAGFTELMIFPFAGGDLRSGVERAAALMPRIRELAR